MFAPAQTYASLVALTEGAAHTELAARPARPLHAWGQAMRVPRALETARERCRLPERADPSEPGRLNQWTGAGKVHERGFRSPAVKQRVTDARAARLPSIKSESKPLVRKNGVRAARYKLSPPGLPTWAQIRDGDLHLHIREVLSIRALNPSDVGCHTDTYFLKHEGPAPRIAARAGFRYWNGTRMDSGTL